MKNKFEFLKATLNICGTGYYELNENEIIVLAPSIIKAEFIHDEEADFLPLKPETEHLQNSDISSWQAVTNIHIYYDEDKDFINWGIILCEDEPPIC